VVSIKSVTQIETVDQQSDVDDDGNAIAAMNVAILATIWAAFRRARVGGKHGGLSG
jgi:hypothetical protein